MFILIEMVQNRLFQLFENILQERLILNVLPIGFFFFFNQKLILLESRF